MTLFTPPINWLWVHSILCYGVSSCVRLKTVLVTWMNFVACFQLKGSKGCMWMNINISNTMYLVPLLFLLSVNGPLDACKINICIIWFNTQNDLFSEQLFIYISQNCSPTVCHVQDVESHLFHLLAFLLKIIGFLFTNDCWISAFTNWKPGSCNKKKQQNARTVVCIYFLTC